MLENMATKFAEELHELKKETLKKMVDEDVFEYTDPEAATLVFKTMGLLDTSTALMLEQAALMDAINKKLDSILAKLEG